MKCSYPFDFAGAALDGSYYARKRWLWKQLIHIQSNSFPEREAVEVVVPPNQGVTLGMTLTVIAFATRPFLHWKQTWMHWLMLLLIVAVPKIVTDSKWVWAHLLSFFFLPPQKMQVGADLLSCNHQ